MKKQAQTKKLETKKDVLLSQTSTEEHTQQTSSEKSTELIKRTKIPNTPFYHIEEEGKDSLIAFGQWRLTPETHKTIEEAKEWLNTNMWDVLAMVSEIIATTLIKQK